MRLPKDLAVAAVVIVLCAAGVLWQLEVGPFAGEAAAATPPLALGERLEVDYALPDAGDPPLRRNVMASYGERATVLYTWSVPCPCVQRVEPRLRALAERFERAGGGVAWVGIDGEPEDTAERVRAKHGAIEAFYPVLRDPEQRLCRRLGLLSACQVAVLDGEGRLAYRGSLDADYEDGRGEHLAEALEAIVAGRKPPVRERGHVYGCDFADPASCAEYEEP
jgi:hypothetical protein